MIFHLFRFDNLSEVNTRKSKANRLLGSLLLVSIIVNLYFAGKGGASCEGRSAPDQ